MKCPYCQKIILFTIDALTPDQVADMVIENDKKVVVIENDNDKGEMS